MTGLFSGLGRFAVRFRGPVVVAWLVVAVICVHLLPSLASVTKDTNSAFLPATAPSTKAAQLAGPFQNSKLAAATLVASTSAGPLTQADQQVGPPHRRTAGDEGAREDGVHAHHRGKVGESQ